MRINVKRDSIWTPDWEKNKKLPEKEQIRFHHRYLTTDERDIYIYVEDMKVVDLTAEDDNRKWIQDKKGIAKAIVTKIENLTLVDEKGKEQHIDKIEQFYSMMRPMRSRHLQCCLKGIVSVSWRGKTQKTQSRLLVLP